jgi:hypothetical protein
VFAVAEALVGLAVALGGAVVSDELVAVLLSLAFAGVFVAVDFGAVSQPSSNTLAKAKTQVFARRLK